MSKETFDSSTIAIDGETFRRFNGGGLNSWFEEGIVYRRESAVACLICRSEDYGAGRLVTSRV